MNDRPIDPFKRVLAPTFGKPAVWELDASSAPTDATHPTCAALQTTAAALQTRKRRDRSSASTAARPPTQARSTPVIPSHSGPSCRVSASTQAATPVMVTRIGRTSVSASTTKAAPAAHRQIPAAISTPLGFTTPFRKSTIGVTATARPTAASRPDRTNESAVTAEASRAAARSALITRITRTPNADGYSNDGHPTAA